MAKKTLYEPTQHEHVANIGSHGLVIMPSIAAMWWMVKASSTTSEMLVSLIYGLALVALFTVSTIWHTISFTGKLRSLRHLFHFGDRATIYIFIAASYTPWLVLKESNNDWGITTLWIVWTMAILGTIFQFFFLDRFKLLETMFYLAIGICPASALLSMKESSGVTELAIGGGLYVFGVIFYKADGKIPFAHAIWHGFVFVAALVQYSAVCKHLLVQPDSVDVHVQT